MKTLHTAICLMGLVGQLVAAEDLTTQGSVDSRKTAGKGSFQLHTFDRVQLTDVYYSEGANSGDIDGDGVADVVYGPYWFAGPGFKVKQEIYPAKAQNRKGYADNFFSWIYDFNGDGRNDVFVVGFPGTPAYVYENPGPAGLKKMWKKHQVFDWVSNESPQFVNIVGDRQPELVCTRNGHFGYATVDWKQPFKPWTFHPVSGQIAAKRFGHGLGVGDIDGDKRLDIITKNGWLQQPASLQDDPLWKVHAVEFSKAGGAEMYAYDVDGDGDNDVITSLQAHAYGLAWHEQIKSGDGIAFRRRQIMGKVPSDNKYGVLFTELHSVNLVDMDGDGLKDIVTGKTFWSHHTKSPLWDAGAVVYWFKLVRGKKGVDWVPYLADNSAGIGRQVSVSDVNKDGLPDIVVGGMKGSHVLLHRRKKVTEREWLDSQPKPFKKTADGLSPQEAARHMTVPPNFRVDLAAGEPQVHQPIAFTIDHRGRLWVAEAHTYPIRAADGAGKDKIIILEDTTGDGRLDSRKVFIDGLNLVSGLEVGFGGVWVGAPPYLMFIPDKDGDDVPDAAPKKQHASLAFPKDVPQGATVLLDGFGYQDTHETLNSFIWGPDGWLYGCHGVFTHSLVGVPGTPAAQRTPFNAGVWRYHPTRHRFEVFAWGSSNPWGVDFNDHGQSFITACVIPHLFHVIQGARYQRQGGRHFNPHVYDDIKTIADHAHYVGNIRDHAWWGHEPNVPHDTSLAGGGHAHCGAMVYLGDNWPDRYRNQLFFNNVHGNRVNNDLLQRQGSGYVGRHGKDLLMANDRWFRGINLKYGPDGSVYLIDWYDKNACHRRNPEIWDRTNGRIYRISYGDCRPASVDLARLDDGSLVKLANHPNDWYVRMSRRILQERCNGPTASANAARRRAISEAIAKDVTVDKSRHRLRAMWLNHVAGEANEDLPAALKDGDPYVRGWAIQLALENRRASPALLARLAEMARDDSSPIVRLYLASALQRIPVEKRWPIAANLVVHGEDAADHNLPNMYWYGIEPLVMADPARALRLGASAKIPTVKRFITRRAAGDNKTLGVVISSLVNLDTSGRILVLDEMLMAFRGRVGIPMPAAWKVTYETLRKSDDASVRERVDQVAIAFGDKRIFPRIRQLVNDGRAKIEKRRQALEILVRGRDEGAAETFLTALSEPKLRGPAIRALAAFDSPLVSRSLVGLYPSLSDAERRDAIGTLVSRPAYAMSLLDAVAKKKLPRSDVHAYHVRQLSRFENKLLDARIKEVWGSIRQASPDRNKLIAKFKSRYAVLKGADVSRGRRLFDRTCASCHKLFGTGGNVGPEITGSNRANLDYILENIIDPSAVLAKDYRMTLLRTESGRVISGLIQKETDSALTIRTINDSVVVAKADIEAQKLSEKSLMPDGLLEQMKPDEVRDLLAYLRNRTQVALRGPKAPINPKTKRVPGAFEGELLKIVGKAPGRPRGQNMSSFSKDRWSNSSHLWWTDARPGARLDLAVPVAADGQFALEVVLTRARDYGVVQLLWDGRQMGTPIDLYSPDVITTGVLRFPLASVTAGDHKLTIEIIGANPKAVKNFMVGLDYVRLLAIEK